MKFFMSRFNIGIDVNVEISISLMYTFLYRLFDVYRNKVCSTTAYRTDI